MLEKVALFPLSFSLLPQGLLTLQIFEVRYLHMIRQCHAENLPFGVVMLAQGREVRHAGTVDRMMNIGCLATLLTVETVQPALLRVHCVGTQLFRLHEHQVAEYGLWRGDIQLLSGQSQVPIPVHLQHCADHLRQLGDHLASQQPPPDPWPWQKPDQLEDCAWVANRWIELLDLTPAQKYSMLIEVDPVARLQRVAAWLKTL